MQSWISLLAAAHFMKPLYLFRKHSIAKRGILKIVFVTSLMILLDQRAEKQAFIILKEVSHT